MKNENAIVRAIDIGYGNVKITTSSSTNGEIKALSFPSIANPVRDNSALGTFIDEKETVVVKVKGGSFEVGPDAGISKSNGSAAILHEEYIKQPQYMALTLGALYYIRQPVIDFLVVGLPVKMMYLADELKKMMIGVHKIKDNISVEVKDCGVLAQPVGGLSYYGMTAGDEVYQNLKTSRNLLIDAGFFTFDWVVSKGFKYDEVRSGSHNSGMSSILTEVAKKMSIDFNVPNYSDFDNIDRGLRTGRARLYGKEINMSPYYKFVDEVSNDSINAMKNSVGDGRDIDNIILIGGSSFAFLPGLKHSFPNHNIITISDSLLANVKGYQLRGDIKALKG